MKEIIRSRRAILRGRDTGKITEFAAHVRLIRVAVLEGSVGQRDLRIRLELVQHGRKALHPVVVLGRQADGRVEQPDKMPCTVARAPLNIGHPPRKPPGIGAQGVGDCGMNQVRTDEPLGKSSLQHLKCGGRRFCALKLLAQDTATRAPHVVDEDMPVGNFSYRHAEDNAPPAGLNETPTTVPAGLGPAR